MTVRLIFPGIFQMPWKLLISTPLKVFFFTSQHYKTVLLIFRVSSFIYIWFIIMLPFKSWLQIMHLLTLMLNFCKIHLYLNEIYFLLHLFHLTVTVTYLGNSEPESTTSGSYYPSFLSALTDKWNAFVLNSVQLPMTVTHNLSQNPDSFSWCALFCQHKNSFYIISDSLSSLMRVVNVVS